MKNEKTTISIDKGIYGNNYKTRDELIKSGYKLSEKRKTELSIFVKEFAKKYPNILE